MVDALEEEDSSEEDDSSESETSDQEGKEALMLVAEHLGSVGDPNNFEDAYNHPDPKKRKGWRDAIEKELQNMEKCKV